MIRSFFHWKVLVNLFVAIALFVGLVLLTFKWLEFHTNHGKEVPVPNIVNMPIQKAIKVLEDVGLEYEIDSFKFDPKYRPYQVLKVTPFSGSHVKSGRTIQIRVNPSTWAKVALPDVLDRYMYVAFRKMELLGLKIGDTLYEPNIQKDALIKMQMNGVVLKPGTYVPRFSVIDVVIGSGPLRNVSVPNVVGLTVAQAKAVITQNYFEVGIIESEDGKNDPNDIVYYQDPEFGAIRDQGMQVDIWSSKKSFAELQGKINALNAMYRKTAPPPPVIDDSGVPIESTPVYTQAPSSGGSSVQQNPNPRPRPSTPRPSSTPNDAAVQPSTNTTPVEAPVEDVPKKKKVVE